MQIFMVGGAVRDSLLGLPISDKDYVVVGASVEQMLARGFRPVGKDFPVFLHPTSQEEYALARTERKTAPGYRGFVFQTHEEVTLEQDLARRDLTIYAIAQADDGSLLDPYGGIADLQARILRHVSPAFAEDPVRILRVARFVARFTEFSVAPETMELMRAMVSSGEVDSLVAERVWQEFARGMMEAQPARMFTLLHEIGALARILPELDRLWGVPQPALHHPEVDTGIHAMLVINDAAAQAHSLDIRFAALMHDLGKGVSPSETLPSHHGHEGEGVLLLEQLCERLKVPNECRDLAVMCAREHGNLRLLNEMRANTIVKLLTRCDAWRKPTRFHAMLLASECDVRGRAGTAEQQASRAEKATQQTSSWMAALRAVQSIHPGTIAREVAAQHPNQPQQIAEAIHHARIAALQSHLRSHSPNIVAASE